jgi:hypothetical protein
MKKQESMSVVLNDPPTNNAGHSTTTSPGDEDFFDDLDDSVFAQLETGESLQDATLASSSNTHENLFWMTFLEILAMLKVS